MKRAIVIADRLAQPAMWLVASLHLLFLASLFTIMLMAPAGAAEASCGGANLVEQYRKDDPARLAQIEAEAAKTPNGQSILWRIEKDGLEPSFLFGTIHLTDPRVTKLTPQAQKAFDGSERLVIETTYIIHETKVLGEMAKRPELMMFTDGRSLADVVSPADMKVLGEELQKRGIPLASVSRMKPWILMSAIAIPSCEMARKASGLKILDVKLATDARQAGKDVVGLETALEQLEALASLPLEFYTQGLIETLKLGKSSDDVFETMIAIYLDGRTDLFWPLLAGAVGHDQQAGAGYADFEQKIVVQRNYVMADRVSPVLAQGGAFVAVGALHLPGKEGVVELLRAKGYTLTAVAAE
ncbi:polysaccharide biosynthesis protein GumN [Salmonella enterica subsp. enterica]|nr:polysaccharide biosynthesis protein GumN [Salmonella enterica subsp. enterica]ECI7685929.1 polysaccharide biosynthesis protein GumN [Salmonella enterica subsp. enterica serovar Paratyphi A]MIL09944.1 polysaccharide biosynthesis protein GumN [Salmonella enterica subsp. enterica serovar Enteritidis]